MEKGRFLIGSFTYSMITALIMGTIYFILGTIIKVGYMIFGVWDKAIHLAVPLVEIVLLIQSIQERKQQRSVAIFGFCAALFIFSCTFVVWFV